MNGVRPKLSWYSWSRGVDPAPLSENVMAAHIAVMVVALFDNDARHD
jgi:hypothetical protein